MKGKGHTFHTGHERMEEGQELARASDQAIYAKVSYLPHTGILMTLEYIT